MTSQMKTVTLNENDWFEVQKFLTKKFNKSVEYRYDRKEPRYGVAPPWLQRSITAIADCSVSKKLDTNDGEPPATVQTLAVNLDTIESKDSYFVDRPWVW